MILYLIALLMHFTIHHSYSQTDDCLNGALRLWGGDLEREGRLEICLNRVWGAVCNDTWTNVNAGVACSQLNHSAVGVSSIKGTFFTQSPINIVFATVRCTGFERRLVECPNNLWNANHCTQNQTVGIVCADVDPEDVPCQNGDIRLQNGSSVSEGRVEICSNQRWGTVCDDHWDDLDARVACHQLGFDRDDSVALSGGNFGSGHGDILLDDLDCSGFEERLVDCSKHEDYHQCTHVEDAGVRCTGHCQNGDIRLRGGSTLQEGRVEICFNSFWGTVCNQMLNELNAAVACLQLGYSSIGAKLVSGNIFASRKIPVRPVLLGDVNCTGSEIRLHDCFLYHGEETCSYRNNLGVICQRICHDGDLRLVDGNSSNEGRVEICHNQVWGSICDDTWNTLNAEVVCRQLNYSTLGAIAYRNAHFGRGMGPVVFSGIQCVGAESRLLECPRKPPQTNTSQCNHERDAGVFCQGYCRDGEVRLHGGTSCLEGRVEVCKSQEWGTVCDQSWNKQDAIVVCRQLGYTQNIHADVIAYHSAYFGRGEGDIFYSQFRCTGSEARLLDCNHSPSLRCLHSDDVGVSCSGAPEPCVDHNVRLVGGQDEREGRVELCKNGVWGTICDNDWDNVDAGVICHELGYAREGSVAFTNAYFGEGVGEVLRDEINCNGSENKLHECRHNVLHPSSLHLCNHSDDAGVRCPDYQPCEEGVLRLVGGDNSREGRVEICYNRQFGTVCDDEWDNLDAIVTCIQLGFSYQGATAFTTSFFGPGSGSIFLSGVRCSGSETSLTECTHSFHNNTCNHNHDAGVRCADLKRTCEPLSAPFCGSVTTTGTRLMSQALYECYSNIVPVPAIRTCIQPGVWTGIQPNCTPNVAINNIRVNHVTPYSASLTWQASECKIYEGQYAIEYVPEFDMQSGTRRKYVRTSHSVITRLVPRTQYQFYVIRDESGGIAQSNIAVKRTLYPKQLEFSFHGQILANNSMIELSIIGIRSSALICVSPCCKYFTPLNQLTWIQPDGNDVPSLGESLAATYTRGIGFLHRDNSRNIQTGIYTCLERTPSLSLRSVYILGYLKRKPNLFIDKVILTNTGVTCISAGRLVTRVRWFKNNDEIHQSNNEYVMSHQISSYPKAVITHHLTTPRRNLYDSSISCEIHDIEGYAVKRAIYGPKSSFKKTTHECETLLTTAVLVVEPLVF